MDRAYLRALRDAEADRITEALQRVQFLHPHRPLLAAVQDAATLAGFCPNAARLAIAWLQLDVAAAVGRLRRTELFQLSRSIRRFWRQNAAAPEASTHPQA